MPKNLEPADYFKDCFGIINNKDSEVQKVVLKVDAFQSNYIRNLPLHDSQKETKRTDEYSIFEYHLKPEFDFEQEIFSNMDAMEVLEPLWLREEVKERIKNLASKYLWKATGSVNWTVSRLCFLFFASYLCADFISAYK